MIQIRYNTIQYDMIQNTIYIIISVGQILIFILLEPISLLNSFITLSLVNGFFHLCLAKKNKPNQPLLHIFCTHLVIFSAVENSKFQIQSLSAPSKLCMLALSVQQTTNRSCVLPRGVSTVCLLFVAKTSLKS